MTLSKAVRAKLDARKSEFDYDTETLNRKLAFAAQTFYQGLPELGSHTTTHAKLFLVFRDLLEMLEAVKTDFTKYTLNHTYTRSKDGTFRVCLDKPASTQNKELEIIENDIKRNYKESLKEAKERVIEEIMLEVEHEIAEKERLKSEAKAKREQSDLRKALLDAA